MESSDDENVKYMMKLIIDSYLYDDLKGLSSMEQQNMEDLLYDLIRDAVDARYRDKLADIAMQKVREKKENEVRERRRSFKVLINKEKE
ncbi:hypothetical protein [Apilactobacillus apinorum]|uniref:Uncharacterized protein n=1 Tax=Apilactobacillus apinorum TaxID=1218495 RepID=A0ABP9ZHR6_9LACO|nr:hypothetical protein [Apilactobacillus apinorum]CAI2610057.1 hypothetical protein AAPFHON13_00880 [Apilactobacillus apinorum]